MSHMAQIVDAVQRRLELILPGNGYRTDAGLRIFRGLETLSSGDRTPTLSIFMDGEKNADAKINCERRVVVGTLLIAAWVVPIKSNSLDPLLDVLRDIKRAVFTVTHPDLETLSQGYKYTGAVLSPAGDNGTFAQLVAEGEIQWMETDSDP